MDFWKERTTETLIANRYKTAGGDRRLDSAVHIANNFVQEAPQLGRGIAGRPIELTPALVGAKRGHMTCDTIDNRLAYWNEPQGTRDEAFVSAFADNQSGSKPKYLVFTADKVCFLLQYFVTVLVHHTKCHSFFYAGRLQQCSHVFRDHFHYCCCNGSNISITARTRHVSIEERWFQETARIRWFL